MVAGNPDVVARLLHRNLLCSARGRPGGTWPALTGRALFTHWMLKNTPPREVREFFSLHFIFRRRRA